MNIFKDKQLQFPEYDREAALEAIFFQASSPLAKELITAIQKTMDYRDSLDYTNVDDKRKHRILMVEKYCSTTLYPAMQKIVSKYTNIEISRVSQATYGRVSGFFAVDISMDDLRDALVIVGQETGTEAGPDTISKSLNEMMKMSENFDAKNARLTSGNFGEGKKRKISAEIWFDANAAFLPKDFLPNSFIDDFTAPEITAIMLHEVGHVMTMVERAGDFYAQTERHVNHLKNLVKFSTPKDMVLDLAKNGDEFFNNLADKEVVTKKEAETMKDAVKSLAYCYEEQDENILKFMASLLMTISMVAIWPIVAILPQFLAAAIASRWVLDGANEFFGSKGKKTTDVKGTKMNHFMFERMADEFVSRMGLGGPLASGLNKLHKIIEMLSAGGDAVAWSEWMRKVKLLHYGYKLVAVIWRIPGSFISDPIIYETPLNRLQRLVQNNMAVYKNKLPVQVRDRYILDCEKIMAAVEETKGNIAHKTARFVMEWLMALTSPTKLLAVLATGRLTNDYQKLLNQMEGLINNKLYYLGAKFQQISEK